MTYFSSTRCVACGELWDDDGIADSLSKEGGAMTYWEALLFEKGAGCPSCNGEGSWEPEMASLDDLDPEDYARMELHERYVNGWSPAWERPSPDEYWKCSRCGIRVVSNPDYHPDNVKGVEWDLAECIRQQTSLHTLTLLDVLGPPPEKPPHMSLASGPLCVLCAEDERPKTFEKQELSRAAKTLNSSNLLRFNLIIETALAEFGALIRTTHAGAVYCNWQERRLFREQVGHIERIQEGIRELLQEEAELSIETILKEFTEEDSDDGQD